MVFSVYLQTVSGSTFSCENCTPAYMCTALHIVRSNVWCQDTQHYLLHLEEIFFGDLFILVLKTHVQLKHKGNLLS